MEGTYGDRDHRAYEATSPRLAGLLREAQERGGKILVPRSRSSGPTRCSTRWPTWSATTTSRRCRCTSTRRSHGSTRSTTAPRGGSPGAAPQPRGRPRPVHAGTCATPARSTSRSRSPPRGAAMVIAGSTRMLAGGRILHRALPRRSRHDRDDRRLPAPSGSLGREAHRRRARAGAHHGPRVRVRARRHGRRPVRARGAAPSCSTGPVRRGRGRAAPGAASPRARVAARRPRRRGPERVHQLSEVELPGGGHREGGG